MDNLKSYITESVRETIKRQIATNGDEFVSEMATSFSSFPIMEAAARKVYDSNTTERMMVLYSAANDEKYVITKKGSTIEGVHLSGGSSNKLTFSNEQKLKAFVADKATEGFRVAQKKSEIKNALKGSSRGMIGFIRKNGIRVGISAALIALIVALLPSGVSDAVKNIANGIGIGDASMSDMPDMGGWLPLSVSATPEVDLSGVEALMSALEGAGQAVDSTRQGLEDLIVTLSRQGNTEAATQVSQTLQNYINDTAASIEQTALTTQAAIDNATSTAAAVAANTQAAQQANAEIIQMINPLYQLQQDLEDQGLDDAAAGVAGNIRQLQSQLRGLN